jgi:site-specific DNA recombinase
MPSTNGHGSSEATERITLYLRVSSLEQREVGTIETQRDYLERYAGGRGLEIADTFADDGVPGTIPFHERAEGQRLLEEARAGNFESFLCYKLDRVGRSLLNVVDAHDRLEALGVGLRSAKEQIETTTPAGRLQFQMLAGFAEFERATIRERTQDGLHRALRAGKQPGRVPYGYRIGDDGSFEVVEDEAHIVAQIFTNIAEGSTIYREVIRLNDLGVPGPGYRIAHKERVPGERWNSTTVSDMLASTTYVGRHEVKANGGQDSIIREVPAIVTTALRERARRALSENRRTPVGRDGKPTRGRRYLLSGLIRCAVCGNPCTAHSAASGGNTTPATTAGVVSAREEVRRATPAFCPLAGSKRSCGRTFAPSSRTPAKLSIACARSLRAPVTRRSWRRDTPTLHGGSARSTKSESATSGFVRGAPSARVSWMATSPTSESRRTIWGFCWKASKRISPGGTRRRSLPPQPRRGF